MRVWLARLSIRTKLILVFLGAAAAAVVLTVLAVLASTLPFSGGDGSRSYNLLQLVRAVEQGSSRVAGAVAAGADAAAIRQVALAPDLPPGVRVQVVTAGGEVWVDTAGNEGRQMTAPELLEWWLLARGGQEGLILPEAIEVNGRFWGIYALSVRPWSGPLRMGDGTLRGNLASWLLASGPVLALVFSLLLFWAYGRHLVQPVQRLSRVVGEIAAGNLAARANLGSRGDELGQLARDVDTMARSLQEAREQAAAAEQSRRFFVAAASHDLRTPLTGILTHAEALRQGIAEDPDQSLAVIQEKGEQLRRLMDDLFVLAALDAGAETWQTVRTDLAERVRQAVVGFLPELEAAGFAVEADIPEEPLWAQLAPGRLERVLDNLLANARKYGATGKWIGVRVARRDDWIRVEVADRGPGIAPAEQERIFDRFYRSDRARTSGTGGSGLGLAVAREIILRHGGRIGVKSPDVAATGPPAGSGATGSPLVHGGGPTPPGGARFWFELPAAT